MRVLYAGGTRCDYKTLQRLILIANEIAFMDRPSVTFGDWGTIGIDSEFRRIDTSNAPITFSVHAPPSGPASRLYRDYIDADLGNNNFISSFITGLSSDKIFQSRFISLEANYGSFTGKDVLDALLQDSSLREANLKDPVRGHLMYQISTPEGRLETLKLLLVEASIYVTNALVISESSELLPVADDPYLCHLISLRSGDSKYVRQRPKVSPYLGLAIASAVIPDEALSKLNVNDLFEYRQVAKDVYESWTIEVDRLATRIDDIDPDELETAISGIINGEVRPRLIEYHNEMKLIRDKLFGDLVKKVTTWEMPTLSLAYLVNLNSASALAAFASALAPAVQPVVDYYLRRREVRRRNSLAYLVGVTKGLE